MQGDKGRETNEEGKFWEAACRETNRETTEEAVILGISMQGDKGRETNEEAVILGISMQGDK